MCMNPFPQQNKSYQFYYDESNNVRKLYLSKQIDGYNIDHDPDKHNSVNFVLAGVAHTGSSSSADFDDLRQRIQLQANAQEFKLKHIAKGDFLTMLTSKKLTAFFEWLLYSDLYLHYFHLNMEYWGYVDIIDDCIHFGIQKGFIKNLSDEGLHHYTLATKDALYNYVRANKVPFIQFLKSYDFPYIEGREQEFIQGLSSQITTHCVNLYTAEHKDTIQIQLAQSLLQLLMACSEQRINELGLTMDIRFEEPQDDDNRLVDGFALFYQHRAMMFSQSSHVFDIEKVVEADLAEAAQAAPHLATLNYSFADSKTNPLIQVSDVSAGFMQRYFDYLNSNSYGKIISDRKNLNKNQRLNMELLQLLIKKTDKHNPTLLHYVMSALEHEKHKAFTYPDEP
ncbi:DUF3800 domain-containing protein [Salmonella enterica]|uniref:DUF3800 domain-containing protein n=1 Tax=Escherichia coli TaxID=562 RepID=UPI001284E711|nr:DUF3800 domain-containing protein [Escherichia coli]EAM9062931.1 hypothetical protein [Salmonella enterica]ECB4423619.1 hypothetical protein [Salmonella enterica subsp. enterica serovar Enteritidis]EDG0737805.1 hypothetical protein [Salmonella enterica subsp. enterica serovar Infantis]EDN4701375.1 hypothetical protein [Salmonella enterica subsp. enterica serovar 6,7:-:1,5]EDO5162264.1 hypothetical protein [Salmonella enterica subsp. enterica serovar Poona]EME8857599.1 DUF3800 domain-contai